jgi:hypothetical protein
MNLDTSHMRLAELLTIAILVVSVSGCAWTTSAGELQTESRTVELEGADSVVVDLKMGAGELTLAGGAEALAEPDFTYNVADWRPTIDYVVAGEQGELLIEQPEVTNLALDSYRHEWDVRLNEDVPMELDVALGAGASDLDVSALSIRRLDLNVGVGDVELDLTGDRDRDLDVTIRGGIGEATVLLPQKVGVEAEVEGALGELDVSGMTRVGDTYVNEAHGASEATITLDIEGGVGAISLKVAE